MARRTRASVVKLTSDRKEGGHHYHLYNRTVRKGFFFADDGIKGLTISLLRDLNTAYALEICRYALMDNHYHLIVRWQPEWVSGWSDAEVVRRWFHIHPPSRLGGTAGDAAPTNLLRQLLLQNPEWLADKRRKLASVSQFMKDFQQRLAEAINRRDKAKGHVWESRFKSVPLATRGDIVGCATYVDLNPYRAGIHRMPEESQWCSLAQTVQAAKMEQTEKAEDLGSQAQGVRQNARQNARKDAQKDAGQSVTGKPARFGDFWCLSMGQGAEANGRRPVIPDWTNRAYLAFVDEMSRLVKAGKQSLNQSMTTLLDRLGLAENLETDEQAGLTHWLMKLLALDPAR